MLKNIKHILIAAGTLLLAASCQSYLSTPPVGSLSPDGFYNTPAHIESGVLGVYSKLQGIEQNQYMTFSEDRSDNVWVDSDPNGIRTCSEVCFYRITSATSEVSDLWAGWYSLIYNANTVLANIDAVEFSGDAIKNQFRGELLFLRALAHFELARTFGNVPVVDHILSSAESKELTQTDAATVIKGSVIPDLTEAESLLPYKASMKNSSGGSVAGDGRADKLAVQALLARVYMTLKGYPFNDASAKSNAQSYLSTVLSNGASYFAPTIEEWKKQWMPAWQDVSNKYQIFGIQHSDTGHGNQMTFVSGTMIKNLTIVHDGYHSGSEMNPVYPEETLRYEYVANNDPRGLGWNFLDGYDAYNDVPVYSNRNGSFTWNGKTVEGFQLSINTKWCPTIQKRAEVGNTFDDSALGVSTGSYNKWPLNFPILRYEDMMLLQAELYAEDGNVSQAMALVNQIRDRAGVPARDTGVSQSEAIRLVRLERQLELYLEGVYWFDMVRYGNWMETTLAKYRRYTGWTNISESNLKAGRYLLPIPARDINATPGLYTQNPDW